MSDLQDRLNAQLFREVPTAFWLDPNLWGDAPKPKPKPAPKPRPAETIPFTPRYLSGPQVAFWEGRRVVESHYHAMTDDIHLILEDGNAVRISRHALYDHRRYQ